MQGKRIARLNSLLKEVISEVINKEVRNPHVHAFVSVTRVETSKDLHHAKVFVSVIASEEDKVATVSALNSAAGFIAANSAKKVVVRYFPNLQFYLDNTVNKLIRIEGVLSKIQSERESRLPTEQVDEREENSSEP